MIDGNQSSKTRHRGVDFDTIPRDWEIVPIRRICTLNTGSTPDRNQSAYWHGTVNWFSAKDLKSQRLAKSEERITTLAVEECVLNVHPRNSLVACFRSGILRHTFPVAVATEPFCVNQDLRAIGVSATSPTFLQYYLSGMNNAILASCRKIGATVESIETKWFLGFPALIPPADEQDRIVRHLDAKTAEIDGLIGKLARQAELLERYRRELIARTVTRGLNPDVPMKDSGIEWIGKVPATWSERPLKSMLRRVSIKNKPERRVLSVERANGVVDRATEGSPDNHNRLPDDLSGYLAVDSGQFVMNKMKAWQGSYGVSKLDGIVSPAYYVFDLRYPNLDFFNWAIRSDAYIPLFGRDSYGIRTDQWDFKISALRLIPFFIPPVEEQAAIVDFLKRETKVLDSAVAGITKQIELLGRYRKQVINDLVTGKVRVEEAV